MSGNKSYGESYQQSSTIHNDTNHRQTRCNFGHCDNTAVQVSPHSDPNKNKAVKSKDQFKMSEQVVRTKLKALLQPVQSGNIASNKDQTPMMSILSTEAMVLVDQAIISVGGEYHLIGLLSTHDRSPDLSFGEKLRPQANEKPAVESATESGVNESLMTHTITVVNQVASDRGDSQQNPNSLADEGALTLVSATLENDSSASQLITEPFADNSLSNEISTRKRSTELLLGEQPIDVQLANEQQSNLLNDLVARVSPPNVPRKSPPRTTDWWSVKKKNRHKKFS